MYYTGISYDAIIRANELRAPLLSRFAQQAKYPRYVLKNFGRDMIRQRQTRKKLMTREIKLLVILKRLHNKMGL
jgi:hypothetical protein